MAVICAHLSVITAKILLHGVPAHPASELAVLIILATQQNSLCPASDNMLA
jgi:hypothetical protein